MKLAGSSVLLTGATGGLGQAIARRLARQDVRLTVTGRRTDQLKSLAAELDARAIAVDLASQDAVVQLARDLDPIDVLVANAALPASGPRGLQYR